MKIWDRIATVTGNYASWCSLILVVLITVDVFLRYFLHFSKAWLGELEWHIFALLFLISMSFTLREDAHVRVDVFYDNYSDKKKAWVNLFGHVFFLIPWCLIIILSSYNYAYNSFSMGEGSPNPGGLPFRYIIKYSITLGFSLLALQGMVQIINSIKIIRN